MLVVLQAQRQQAAIKIRDNSPRDARGPVTYLDSKYKKNLVGLNGASFSNALFQLPGRRTFGSQYALTTAVSYTPEITDNLRALFYVVT